MAREWRKQTCIYTLNPGHEFQADDEQLLSTYLMGKIRGFNNLIPTVNFKTFHPKELTGLGGEDNKEWYCFTRMEAKSITGTWSTSEGLWNPFGRDEIIFNREGRAIGFKKLFGYLIGGEPANRILIQSKWRMHEYRISDDSTVKTDNKWVLCKIYIDEAAEVDYDIFPDGIIRRIPKNIVNRLSQLVSSYQSLSPGDTKRGPLIVKSILRVSRQCKLDKVLYLPEEGKKSSAQERDLIVGKVYSKIMEIESRLLPCGCGLHVASDHQPPGTMKLIATVINIGSHDCSHDYLLPLPRILAHTLGRKIEDVYRGCGKGLAPDMELLRHITEASRCAITTFVERNINKKWRKHEISGNVAEILGFDRDELVPQSQHDFDVDDLIDFTHFFRLLAEYICMLDY